MIVLVPTSVVELVTPATFPLELVDTLLVLTLDAVVAADVVGEVLLSTDVVAVVGTEEVEVLAAAEVADVTTLEVWDTAVV